MKTPDRSRGFTLLELCFVVAIIGILASMAIPNFIVYQLQAKSAEALIHVETIAYLEQVRILETGESLACEPVPAEIPKTDEKSYFNPTQAWKDLGLQIRGHVRYQYEVKKTGPRDFVVIARGNLDGDEDISEYSLDSETMSIVSKNPGD